MSITMVSARLCRLRARPGSESIEAGRAGALNNINHDGLSPPLRPPGRTRIRVDRGGEGRSTQQCSRLLSASAAPGLGPDPSRSRRGGQEHSTMSITMGLGPPGPLRPPGQAWNRVDRGDDGRSTQQSRWAQSVHHDGLSPPGLGGPQAGPGSESIEAGRAGALNNVNHDGLCPLLLALGQAWIRVDRGGEGRSTKKNIYHDGLGPPLPSRFSVGPSRSGLRKWEPRSLRVLKFGDNRHCGARHPDGEFYCGKVKFPVDPATTESPPAQKQFVIVTPVWSPLL
jgi:hypothetical protein